MSDPRVSVRFSTTDLVVLRRACSLLMMIYRMGPPSWANCVSPKIKGCFDATLFDVFVQCNMKLAQRGKGRSRFRFSHLELTALSAVVRLMRRQIRIGRLQKPNPSPNDIAHALHTLEVYTKRARRKDPSPAPPGWKPLLQWIRNQLFAYSLPPHRSWALKYVRAKTKEKAYALAEAELVKRKVEILDHQEVHKVVDYKLKLDARKERRDCPREVFVQLPDAAERLADFVMKQDRGIKKPKEHWEEIVEAYRKLREITGRI